MTHAQDDRDAEQELDELRAQATPDTDEAQEGNDAAVPVPDPATRGAPPSIDEGEPETTDDGSGTSETD